MTSSTGQIYLPSAQQFSYLFSLYSVCYRYIQKLFFLPVQLETIFVKGNSAVLQLFLGNMLRGPFLFEKNK